MSNIENWLNKVRQMRKPEIRMAVRTTFAGLMLVILAACTGENVTRTPFAAPSDSDPPPPTPTLVDQLLEPNPVDQIQWKHTFIADAPITIYDAITKAFGVETLSTFVDLAAVQRRVVDGKTICIVYGNFQDVKFAFIIPGLDDVAPGDVVLSGEAGDGENGSESDVHLMREALGCPSSADATITIFLDAERDTFDPEKIVQRLTLYVKVGDEINNQTLASYTFRFKNINADKWMMETSSGNWVKVDEGLGFGPDFDPSALIDFWETR